jgi:NTE family protein
VFERDELRDDRATITTHQPADLDSGMPQPRDIGLALSGGGSRAIAFHLGCLRALHDGGVLDRVQVVSGVSGGSVMTGLWAYSEDTFDEFDARVYELLRRGLAKDIARQALLSMRTPLAFASSLAAAARLGRRTVNRTDALRVALAKRVCGDVLLSGPRRADVATVINATDLSTGSAFRFGNRESGTWRHGTVAGNNIDVATAIAASAAYPVLLPALDRQWEFEPRDGGERQDHRVVLTDGGVFDNLGISCLLPGRDRSISTNVYDDVEYVIACDAGQGLFGSRTPVFWPSRMKRSFETTHRKLQDAGRARLHDAQEAGDIRGFLHAYLGQQDRRLVDPPADLVARESVIDYPTNFSAMPADDVARLSKRGEQLTRLAMQTYLPEL